MALNTVLLLAAGMGASLGFQDPAFDMQFAIPVVDHSARFELPLQGEQTNSNQNAAATVNVQTTNSTPAVFEIAQAIQVSQSKKVSAQFKGAKVSEVLNWLQEQGVSFVVSDGMIPPSATVTLSVTDQPVDDVVEALATALGGHWQRSNGIRVFKPGENPLIMAPMGALTGTGQNFRSLAPMKMNEEVFKKLAPLGKMETIQGFKFDEKEFQKHFGPEFQKNMEKMAKDMAANQKNQKDWAKEFGPEYQKKMEVMAKELATKFGPEFHKDMEKKFGPEFQKEMELHAKEMAKLGQELAKTEGMRARAGQELRIETRNGDTRAFVFDSTGKALKVDGNVKVRAGTRVNGENLKIYTVTGKGSKGSAVDAKKFLSSLTSDQKQSQRMKGFVYYIDLSKEQKAMLGDVPKGRFEITLNVNGEKVTVRGS